MKKIEGIFNSVQEKIYNGLAFTMSKVAIVSDAKNQYIQPIPSKQS